MIFPMALDLVWMRDIYDGLRTLLTLILAMALELFWLYDNYDGLRIVFTVWYLQWLYIQNSSKAIENIIHSEQF
jgi:hypothetical protein